MNPSRPLKRVARACDYCRKKRLKCTGQRPCMNCQLYGATCTASDGKAPEQIGQVAGEKRSQDAAGIERDREHETDQRDQTVQADTIETQPGQPDNQTDTIERPTEQIEWNPTTQSDMPSLVPEIAPEFDQYAQDLGLVLAPFWPQNTEMALPLTLDLPAESVSSLSYPAPLPTPTHSGPVYQGLDLLQSPYGAQPDPPGRSAHEMFLRKGSDTKFIGMGSVGSTISECLRYSVNNHGGSMESTILAHLVNGIRHVDELSLSTAFQHPPLPEKAFAEQGIQAYHDFVHLLYPIMDGEFAATWRQIYNHDSLSAISYCRFCLVILVGNIVSPAHSHRDNWQASQRLHEQTWSLLDRVMASPFIESLQVMLLHTVFLLYCGKTGIAWMTCSMAVHIAQSLGLHQHPPPQLGLTPQQTTLRSNLWAVAYTLDAFLSLSEGRPSSITGPPRVERQSVANSNTAIHDWHVSLAKIAEIDAQLLAWKDSIPMEYRPDQQILAEDHDPLYVLVAMLHLKYHNLMRTIHWISLTLSSELPPTNTNSSLHPRIRTSESTALSSSRSIIEVLNCTSSKSNHSRCPGGFIVPYCMAAISIFYRQILKEPTRQSVRADLEYMRSGTMHVTTLVEGIESRGHFGALFGEMLRVAEGVVRRAGGSE
ncbi:fungal-specific transcription factor domain-containing protein [Aspergillus unguis]